MTPELILWIVLPLSLSLSGLESRFPEVSRVCWSWLEFLCSHSYRPLMHIDTDLHHVTDSHQLPSFCFMQILLIMPLNFISNKQINIDGILKHFYTEFKYAQAQFSALQQKCVVWIEVFKVHYNFCQILHACCQVQCKTILCVRKQKLLSLLQVSLIFLSKDMSTSVLDWVKPWHLIFASELPSFTSGI